MRAIMHPNNKQQLEGIYTFRFHNKVYQCQVKAAIAYYKLDVLARPSNGQWELLKTVPMMEIMVNSPEWREWRESLRTMVGKHFKQI